MNKMPECKECGKNVINFHSLVMTELSPMKNGVNIITPTCKCCNARIEPCDVSNNIKRNQKVYLLSGTCASGKSSIGKYVEENYGYILIDGDAISKRVNYDVKQGVIKEQNEFLVHSEVIKMMLVVLGLGYSVFISYVFDEDDFNNYIRILEKYDITPEIGILIPNRDTCIRRDIERKCWTAGVNFIDRWYESQMELGKIFTKSVIDNSNESIEETVELHIKNHL